MLYLFRKLAIAFILFSLVQNTIFAQSGATPPSLNNRRDGVPVGDPKHQRNYAAIKLASIITGGMATGLSFYASQGSDAGNIAGICGDSAFLIFLATLAVYVPTHFDLKTCGHKFTFGIELGITVLEAAALGLLAYSYSQKTSSEPSTGAAALAPAYSLTYLAMVLNTMVILTPVLRKYICPNCCMPPAKPEATAPAPATAVAPIQPPQPGQPNLQPAP